MKTSTRNRCRTTERDNRNVVERDEPVERDPLDTFMLGVMAVCVVALAVTASIAWPAAYIVTILVIALVFTIGTTITVAGSLLNSGTFLDFIVADQVLRGGIEIAGWCVYGTVKVLAASACGSSD